MISANGGMVTQIGIMKKRPAMPPTGTQREMALGTVEELVWAFDVVLGSENRALNVGVV